jgi:hypothetical protein
MKPPKRAIIYDYILWGKKIKRVNCPPVFIYRKMEVGTGTITGIAHFSNFYTLPHLIALFYRNYAEVSVHGLKVVSMT